MTIETVSERKKYVDYFTDYETVRKSLFLGQPLGLLENLRNEFPEIWVFYKQLKNLDWEESELPVKSCKQEFLVHDPEVTDLMRKTLAFQYEGDTSASQIGKLMYPFVTNTELFCYVTELTKNECLTPDHEVLTPQGWKSIAGITVEDKVAQWDWETREITFVNPNGVIERDHSGLMYHFTDEVRNVDQLVTPNHRLPLLTPYWGNPRKEWDYAEDIRFHGGNALPTAGNITTKGPGMTPQERLYLAVQADGSLCPEAYTGTRSGKKHYRFGLKKERKIARLSLLSAMAGWELREEASNRADGCRTFRLYVPEEEYNDQAKTFDWIKLDQISQQWCLDFLSEICNWDGNITANNRGRYITSRKENLDKVCAIAHLVSHRAHVTVIPARENAPMPGGSTSNTKEAYQVHFTDRDYVAGNSISKTEVQYEGKVYCLTVPSSYFMVRRNNTVSVTGNCVHSLAYKFIVENCFDNPLEFLEYVKSLESSFRRLSAVQRVFEEIYQLGLEYQTGNVVDENVIRKALLKFWATLYCLERIQFIASFAITFGLAENNYFVPIGKLVQKIATEEFQVHVQADKAILRNELSIPETFALFLEIAPEISEIIHEVTMSEITWLEEELFRDKKVIAGIYHEKIKKTVIYASQEVYQFFGIESPFEHLFENPLPSMDEWLVIDNNQASPQEEATGNYLLGGFVDDRDTLDIFKKYPMITSGASLERFAL